MILKLLIISVFVIICESKHNQLNRYEELAEVEVWPHPQSASVSSNYLSIDSTNFKFIGKSAKNCDLLYKAIARYEELTFLQDCSKLSSRGKRPNIKTYKNFTDNNYIGLLNSITIDIKSCEHLPHMYMNENYTLVVNTKGAHIISPTIWGAIRGLETFSQLVKHVGVNQFTINELIIDDFPRFTHRGLLVDTSRHYISVNVILQNLEAMAYNKLNVFHWHIVDDQSFPYVSKRFPDLSGKGAYDAETHVYTPNDVKNIIEYARERGIRVVVEFDSPGHTLSWGRGHPELLAQCDGQNRLIDPTKQSVYTFIEELFTELSQAFPDNYFHLGGDEVNTLCWQSSPSIKKFMLENSIQNTFKLQDYYMQNILEIVKGLNKSYIVWEEIFSNGVNIKPDTVVQVWKPNWNQVMSDVVAKGFRAILSSCWYLDAINTFWTEYYNCEPFRFDSNEDGYQLVIGGEAAMWGENVDGSNLISRVWPRACATAERLWSPKSFNDSNKAKKRFNKQRCLMQERGFRAQPSNPTNEPEFCRCDYAL